MFDFFRRIFGKKKPDSRMIIRKRDVERDNIMGGIIRAIPLAGVPAPTSDSSQRDVKEDFIRVDGTENVRIRHKHKALLKCTKGEYEGRKIPFFDGDILGRDTSSIVFLNDLMVSRRHCCFSHCDGQWFIESFGTNGTCVNGRKIPFGQPVMLEGGAVIDICGNEFVFHRDEVDET